MDYLVTAGLDPDLSSTDSTQEYVVDVEHQATDLAVLGSGSEAVPGGE
jgi:hypothetical protein